MIYEIYAYTYDKKVEFNKKFLSYEYACDVFKAAMECCDVWLVQMCDATTGEIIMDYNRKSGTLASYI